MTIQAPKRPELTHEYFTRGYAVFRSLVPGEIVEAAKRRAFELFAQGPSAFVELEADGRTPLRLRSPTTLSPVFEEIARWPPLLDALETILGPHIRFVWSKLNAKAGHGGAAIDFHQDNAYFPMSNADMVTCAVHLDEATSANGCLQIIPSKPSIAFNSHHDGERFSGRLPAEVVARLGEPVAIEASPGDVVVFAASVVHGSDANHSGSGRMIVFSSYAADDCLPIYDGRHWMHAEPDAWRMVRGRDRGLVRIGDKTVRRPPARAAYASIFEYQGAEVARASPEGTPAESPTAPHTPRDV